MNNGYKTGFESSVNSEGIETIITGDTDDDLFESSVNSEGIETVTSESPQLTCLRAV